MRNGQDFLERDGMVPGVILSETKNPESEMPKSPPPLLAKVLARVLSLSRANSWGVCGFAGACALIALVQAQWTVAAWGGLISAAGAVEVHGRSRLRAGRASGLNGMILSQFLVLAALWAYAWFRWKGFDAEAYWQEWPAFAQVQLTKKLIAEGLDPVADRPLLLEVMNALVCLSLALATLVYQGGLAFYYALKAGAIRAALPAGTADSGSRLS